MITASEFTAACEAVGLDEKLFWLRVGNGLFVPKDEILKEADSASNCIANYLTWAKTPDGEEYWSHYWDRLQEYESSKIVKESELKMNPIKFKFKVGDKIKGRGWYLHEYLIVEHIGPKYIYGLDKHGNGHAYLVNNDWTLFSESPKKMVTKWLWASPNGNCHTGEFYSEALFGFPVKLLWSATEFEVSE